MLVREVPNAGSVATITVAADARWHQNADVDVINATTGALIEIHHTFRSADWCVAALQV